MVSTAVALTNQFYAWEQRGRGWQVVNFSCDLEPPFVPFFGHFLEPEEIIDDGRRPPWWSTLLFGPSSPDSRTAPHEDNELVAFPYTDESNALSIYTVTLPKQYKAHKDRIAQLLVILSYRKSPVSFEIIATDTEISLEWVVSDSDAAFFHSQINAFFPECTILLSETDKILEVLQPADCLYTVDFGLSEEFMRPISTHASADHDSYTPLFGILERLDLDEAVIIQVLFSGLHNPWGESMQTAVCDHSGKTSFFLDAPEMPQLAKEKGASPLFAATVRAVTIAGTMQQAARLLQQVATSIIHASTSPFNSLIPLPSEQYTINLRLADIVMRETHRLGFVVNAAELATFAHFPAIQSKKLIATIHTTKQAPLTLINHPYTLGLNEHQRIQQLVGIGTEQRLRHIHILGATGTGKSTLLKSLIMQDVLAGTGLMCLDPHGDLIDDILVNISQERVKDVVLIDPSDNEFPIGFNILVAHSDIEKELLASDLVAVFKRFSTSWGDAMNSVLANAILAFVYNTKQYHLGDLRRFLIETPYRAKILATVIDPDIAYYWQTEYPILKSSSIGPILTRLDAFLRPRVIRNMVCQKQSLDFAQLMDTNKIVLVKLSQGLLGAENSFLLGAFIVSKLQQTAMARQAQGAQSRVPFFCYIDEFQHFITPSMASILSGARKYGLGLVLCHQDMQQVAKYDPEIAASVLANAGTRICFRLGDTDAKRLQDGFSAFSSEDLENLETGEAIARVNTRDADFNLTVIPYHPISEINCLSEIVQYSRSTYSVPIVQQQPIITEAEPVTFPPQTTIIKEPINEVNEEVPLATKESIREHRYLQTFIKALGESHGYRANIEVPTPDGNGFVDVLLEKDNETIAVEISVTTTAEWELHNVRKCLAAGYSNVIVCVSQSTKLKAIQQQVSSHLSQMEQQKVKIIASGDIPLIFATDTQAQPADTLIKGYRVKVNYEANPNRQDLLQSIINASKKR